jgi:hypothetical protein
MNTKEMETLLKEQGLMIAALGTAIEDHKQAVERARAEFIEHRAATMGVVQGLIEEVRIFGTLMGYDTADEQGPFFGEMTSIRAHLEELDVLVKGRNKSAAVKRNMTDADALRVLTGEYREVPHKEAAEAIGLTYAQVYSCRLEYTFKHVHHELRKDKEYKSQWKK